MIELLSGRYVHAWPSRYELLDGIRGLACIVVVLHHIGIVTVGHYAVMVFFVISGYCITASTLTGLRKGTSFVELMGRRVRRIFPPYLLAMIFFAATRVAKSVFDPAFSWDPTWLQWLQNLTLTQWLSLPFASYAEASQNSTLFVASFWSLNYEEQFYVVMGVAALLARQMSISILTTVTLLAVAGLAWNSAIPGGWVSGFFLEYWVHFSLGSLLYFLLVEASGRGAWLIFMLGMMLLAVVSLSQLLPWHGETTFAAQRAFLELAVLSAVSILLAFLRPYSAAISGSIFWRPLAFVGTISYSLYLVHQFNLHLVSQVAGRLLPLSTPSAINTIVCLMLHIGIGTAFWWACERPFLNNPASTTRLTPA